MEEIIVFHDQILFALAIILIVVIVLLYQALTIKVPYQGVYSRGCGGGYTSWSSFNCLT